MKIFQWENIRKKKMLEIINIYGNTKDDVFHTSNGKWIFVEQRMFF